MADSLASLQGRLGAHVKWGNCTDRSAATAPARAAFEQRFLDEAGGDVERAASLRKAYFARIALKSAKARARKKQRGERGDPDAELRLVEVTR